METRINLASIAIQDFIGKTHTHFEMSSYLQSVTGPKICIRMCNFECADC